MFWFVTLLPKVQRLPFPWTWHSCISKGCHRDRTTGRVERYSMGNIVYSRKPVSLWKMHIAAPCFSAHNHGIPQDCPPRSLRPLCTAAVWLHHGVCVREGGMPPSQPPALSDQHLVFVGGPPCGQQICPNLHPAGKATKRVCVQTASASINAWKNILF